MRAAIRQAVRATALLVPSVALAFFSILFITVMIITVVGTLAVVAAGLLPETVLLIRRMAGMKRHRVAGWTGREIPEAYLPLRGTLWDRIRTALQDTCTYADLRWMLTHYLYGFLGLLAVPLWVLGLAVDGAWCGLLRRGAVVLPLISRLAELDATWSYALLKPPPKALLAERVTVLTETRASAIAAHSAELRRIERDLHDGTQARLVALSMRIGLAKRAFDRDPETARKLMDEAQDQAQAALTELRHVVRAIHPPILTDRGLVGAVRALAAGSGLDVAIEFENLPDGGPRAPAAVEAAAYFLVAEALTNVAKYSGVTRAEARLERLPNGLCVRVRDEGRGGADDAQGSGLLGIRRRVAALDGSFSLTSPVGGPTVIEVELPCVW